MPQCSAYACTNRTDQQKEKSFHRFPFSRPELLKSWVRSIRRENWEPSKTAVICSDHFEEDCFDRTGQTVRLRSDAQPTVFNFPEHLMQVNRERKLPMARTVPITRPNNFEGDDANDTGTSQVIDHDHHYYLSPKKMKVKLENAMERKGQVAKQLKGFKEKNSRLRKKVKSLNDVVENLKKSSLMSSDALDILEQTFTGVPLEMLQRMVKNLSSNSITRERYPPLLKKFALTLQFYSTKAYKYVRNTFGLALPHPSVIRSWSSNVNAEPGFSEEAGQALKVKVRQCAEVGRKVICSLMLDEMSIKEHLEWDGHQYRGYIDLGTDILPEACDLPLASHALVFMVVSLDSSWKIPVAYYFIRSLTGEERANLVTAVITKLFDLGVTVTSITFDGPRCHFSMVKHLGGNLQLPNAVHWFPHPCDASEKVYIILDICHMLKLIRNTWAKLGVYKTEHGELIEWRYITALHELQAQEGLRAGNKLRLAHIRFYQQKMKVNLAAQTLSDSVADALIFCCDVLKLPQFKNVHATVEFIKLINKLFDLLNSRNPLGKGSKAPLTVSNRADWEPFLIKALPYIMNLTDPSGKPLHTTPLKVPFVGFCVSVMSVMKIFDVFVAPPTSQVKYLLTYKLSQDHLELLFCGIRARGGWNNNPNVLQFISAYKKLLLPHQVCEEGGNVNTQDDTRILTTTRDYINTSSSLEIDVTDVALSIVNDIDLGCTVDNYDRAPIPKVTISEYLENTVAYISGYVVKMVKKRVHCDECTAALVTDAAVDTSLKLLTIKSRGQLIVPSHDTIRVCMTTEKHFRMFLSNNGSQPLAKANSRSMLTLVSCVLSEVGSDSFAQLSNHMLSTSAESNHVFRLIKIISESYAKIRFFHEGKDFSEKIHRDLIRKDLSRLVIHRHQ